MPIISVDKFAIPGPARLQLKRAGDERGWFSETWNAKDWLEAGLSEEKWVQDNHAFSAERGTTRGLHFQAPPHAQAKLIQVIRGRIFDAIVDLRTGSPTFGQSVCLELSSDAPQAFYVPVGFAHGYQTLAPDTLVYYKVTDYYAPQTEGGLLWNGKAVGVDWPMKQDVTLSKRDHDWPDLDTLASPFQYLA
ncbi:dTDP-4-dehydrorhamnose 3,5-epimerase [Henriciella barbarensis]|uniref:dTDP-4-dehydrorhamnose 3,5-epimerase n=1 Tax=Henriciella barbarensis TaxID=86342 RepID=A0A399QXV1_9PROT|nr:dTDP-4-dehydrorhamnose 3,5-epimerase [Henriciella barbarensis]RIJ23748.1 dTDP-4-dehydrorhamnose 3,5-epimerase [Henriciella barbarensis]